MYAYSKYKIYIMLTDHMQALVSFFPSANPTYFSEPLD